VGNDGNQRVDRINLSKDNGSKFHPDYVPTGCISEGLSRWADRRKFARLSPDDIGVYFRRLIAIVDKATVHFVFHAFDVDEMGHQDRQIATKKHVMRHQTPLVVKFPPLFPDQARESLWSFVSALTNLS
jgi:hypothetical protein